MAWARAAIALGVLVLAVVGLSGAHADDPRTPAGLSGVPPPFLGIAVVGSGARTAAVDAYGDVVDLRGPGPAGTPLIAVSAKRQAAGTVTPGEAVVARARLADGRTPPLWRADRVRQRYLPETNVLRTTAWLGDSRTVIVRRAEPGEARADRRWLAHAQPLGAAAPAWARGMYRRSLLVLQALTDRRSGAVAAGARDGWAYAWPRDASAVAIALASSGYATEAKRVAHFLLGLDLSAAARFHGIGSPVPERAAQGDATGWVAAAARAAGLPTTAAVDPGWRGHADYQEGDPGDYLGNAIAGASGPSASRHLKALFGTNRGLERSANDPGSGLDSAAAWAVRPFPQPALFPIVRRTLLRLVAERGTRFGLLPSEDWDGGGEPWTAPTAWTAWALAALAGAERNRPPHAEVDRRTALSLIADLRRAATPLGLLPERVNPRTGLPTSTTPLAWSHAFAILAIRALWPAHAGDQRPVVGAQVTRPRR